MEVPELVVAKGGAKLKELALDPSTSDSGAIESMRRVGRKIGDEGRSSVRLWRRSGDQFEWRGRGASGALVGRQATQGDHLSGCGGRAEIGSSGAVGGHADKKRHLPGGRGTRHLIAGIRNEQCRESATQKLFESAAGRQRRGTHRWSGIR